MELSNKELGKYLKVVREQLGYSIYDVNNLCEISPSYMSLMENGKRRPSPIILKKLSSIYHINCNDLYAKAGYSELIDVPMEREAKQDIPDISDKLYMIPLYGEISAGLPNWAEECLEGYLPIAPELMHILNPKEYYFLRVNGESMNRVIRNGAYALIHKQESVEDGEIAVILVNGDSATIKRFRKQGDTVALYPESTDNSFFPQIYDKSTQIQIIGKYVGKFEIN